MKLEYVPTVIYACFVLHNICEINGITMEPDDMARQLYASNTAEGTYLRDLITLMFKEHIPH